MPSFFGSSSTQTKSSSSAFSRFSGSSPFSNAKWSPAVSPGRSDSSHQTGTPGLFQGQVPQSVSPPRGQRHSYEPFQTASSKDPRDGPQSTQQSPQRTVLPTHETRFKGFGTVSSNSQNSGKPLSNTSGSTNSNGGQDIAQGGSSRPSP